MIHTFYIGFLTLITTGGMELGRMPGWCIPISISCALAIGRWLTDKFERPWQDQLRKKQGGTFDKLCGCGAGGCWAPVLCLHSGLLCVLGFIHWWKGREPNADATIPVIPTTTSGGSASAEPSQPSASATAQGLAPPTPERIGMQTESTPP